MRNATGMPISEKVRRGRTVTHNRIAEQRDRRCHACRRAAAPSKAASRATTCGITAPGGRDHQGADPRRGRGGARCSRSRGTEVHLLELDPGDVHEEPAGARLAAAACGDGVEVKGYSGGQWTLGAQRRGLVRVNAAALAAVNALEGMSVFTLYDRQPVEVGEAVARPRSPRWPSRERLVKDADERAGERRRRPGRGEAPSSPRRAGPR